MLVSIFRHGIAVPREDVEGVADAERPLTERGVKRTRAAAKGFKALGRVPDAIYTSPYVRARQTAELLALALGRTAPALTITEALLPDAAPDRMLNELTAAGVEQPLCVGHAPHLDVFVAHLLGLVKPVTELGKAGLAVVDVANVTPRRGTLVGVYRPGELRSLR